MSENGSIDEEEDNDNNTQDIDIDVINNHNNLKKREKKKEIESKLDPLFVLNYKYVCTNFLNHRNIDDIKFSRQGKYPWQLETSTIKFDKLPEFD